jgi:hypothetical protein
MLYKTLYLKANPNAEYQRRNGVWWKRKIGTKEMWYKVDTKGQQVLNNVYQGKSPLFYYSNTALLGGVICVAFIGYAVLRKQKGLPIFNF